jgi:hypothetical protein
MREGVGGQHSEIWIWHLVDRVFADLPPPLSVLVGLMRGRIQEQMHLFLVQMKLPVEVGPFLVDVAFDPPLPVEMFGEAGSCTGTERLQVHGCGHGTGPYGGFPPAPPLQEEPRSPYEPQPRNISNDDTDILPSVLQRPLQH